MKAKKISPWAVYGALAGLWLGLMGLFLYGQLFPALISDQPVAVRVSRGESFKSITRRLTAEDKLNNPFLFRLLALVRGDMARARAGEFVLKGYITPNGLLNALVSSSSRTVRLTVPEGYNLREIALRMDDEIHLNGKRFYQLANDPAFIATLGLPPEFPQHTLEGLLFPETYYFSAGVREEEVIGQMVAQFKQRALAPLREYSRRVGLSPYQALTLASIIEKETGVASERRLISSVFHNRLRIEMPLATDPTVIYGVKHFDGNLTRKHLRTRTPYNTYMNKGLPPTPITNPGIEAIQAAINPEKTSYLYFVAKGGGSHFFSSDFKTHSQAVYKYQVAPLRGKQKRP